MYHHPATMAAAAAAAEAAAVAASGSPSSAAAAAAAAAASRGFDPLLMAPSHLSAPKVIICCLCDFQAFSKGNLSFHLNNVHFKDKEFMCRMCHFKTAYKGALTRHVNSVHLRTGKTKECPICGYTTASLLNLNSHLSQTHHLDIATAFARPSNSTKGKPAPKPEKKDPRGPQSSKTNGSGGPPPQPSPPPPNPAAPAAPSHPPHAPTQPPPPHQPEIHGPSAAAAVAAKAATAAELVTQYNLAQLHAAYNELNRNRVAAAAAAQAMADHRASALQQAAAMTAAAAENSPPRSAAYHREPQPSPPPQSAMRLTRDVPEDLRDPSPTRSRILREQEILRNNAQQHSSRLYATNGIQAAAPSPYPHHHHHLAHNSSPPDERRSPGIELGESPPRSNYLLHHHQQSSQPSSSSSLYHRLQHHPSESPPLPPPSVSPVGFQCRLCTFQGRSATYLKNHYRTVHLDEVHTVACPHCEYTSDTRHDLDMHVDQEHGGSNGAASPGHPEGKETSVIAL